MLTGQVSTKLSLAHSFHLVSWCVSPSFLWPRSQVQLNYMALTKGHLGKVG